MSTDIEKTSGTTFEERRDSALNFKAGIKQSLLDFTAQHKSLSKKIGDNTAKRLLKCDVNSMTTIGIFKRNVFINALPIRVSSMLKHGKINRREFDHVFKGNRCVTSETKDNVTFDVDGLAEIKILNSDRDLHDAIDTMIEEGSTGDKLQKLNEHILRFGAMFLLFVESEECNKFFTEWGDKLTTNIVQTNEDGTEQELTKEQEIELDSERPHVWVCKVHDKCEDEDCEDKIQI